MGDYQCAGLLRRFVADDHWHADYGDGYHEEAQAKQDEQLQFSRCPHTHEQMENPKINHPESRRIDRWINYRMRGSREPNTSGSGINISIPSVAILKAPIVIN